VSATTLRRYTTKSWTNCCSVCGKNVIKLFAVTRVTCRLKSRVIQLCQIHFMTKWLKSLQRGKWYCSKWTSPSVRSSKPLVNTGLLSCVGFNAKSAMSRGFDFLSYICAHRFDIVAVTETFLDDPYVILKLFNVDTWCFAVIKIDVVVV